jgi:hypothetical protein
LLLSDRLTGSEQVLIPLQSVEMVLGAASLMLFVARMPRRAAGFAALSAAAAVGLTLLLLHVVVRSVIPMTAASLVALLLTSAAVVSGREIPAVTGVLWSAAYGVLYGLSAYELQFFRMDLYLLVSDVLLAGLAGIAGATVLARMRQPAVVIAIRVVASWLAAAAILMLAFFL